MAGLLESIRSPADVRALSFQQMESLASEVRKLILETVAANGGHLAPNLGVVELTIAVLAVFDPPRDRIVWDVSHQTYAYKILTDRRDRFHTLRQRNGISGFLRRDESPYDAFGAGHSGTALSAALGMAVARDRRSSDEHVVAILGDGSAGCGISLEAMNNIASTTSRFIVILNDNEMSIAKNVGSVSRHLASLLTSPRFNKFKRSVERFCWKLRLGWLRFAYYRIEEAIKSLVLGSAFFEEMGLRYVGPVDGHSLPALVDALNIARDSDRPILIHVVTEKGRGYRPAAEEPEKWHGVPRFDIATGRVMADSPSPGYSAVMGNALCRLAADDRRIVAITAGMARGTGLSEFAERFPDRFFDVGISEEHAVIFAAGLAAEGMIPVFAVYSTFLQRAVDCVIHDVCLQNLHVVICVDRAGIVGEDGPTHHGVFDIPLLRSIPNLVFMQPRDEPELANMLATAVRLGRPAAVRYPRGSGSGASAPEKPEPLPVGKAETLRKGSDIQIWALGDMVPLALKAADIISSRSGLACGVVNARFIRPPDEILLASHLTSARLIATIENGMVAGGFGSGLREASERMGHNTPFVNIGWPDSFVPHGEISTLLREHGFTPEAVAEKILRRFNQKST